MSSARPSADPPDSSQQDAQPSNQARLLMGPTDIGTLTASQAGFINTITVLEDEFKYSPVYGQPLNATIAKLFPPTAYAALRNRYTSFV